jgi:hypothetical protein
MEHAHAFRNALLIASLHYTLNTGNTQHFQSTFLFHKLQTIRMVNGWLVDQISDSVTSIIRQVASLCFVEVGTMLSIPSPNTNSRRSSALVRLLMPRLTSMASLAS